MAHKCHALNQGLLSRDEVINGFPVLPQLAVGFCCFMFCPDCGAKIWTNLRNVEIIIITVKHLHKLRRYLQNKMRDLNSGRHHSLNYQQKSRGGKECQIWSFLGLPGGSWSLSQLHLGKGRVHSSLQGHTVGEHLGPWYFVQAGPSRNCPQEECCFLQVWRTVFFGSGQIVYWFRKFANIVSHITMANAHCSHQLAQ